MRPFLCSAFFSIATISPVLSGEVSPEVETTTASWETLVADALNAFENTDAGALSKALDTAAKVNLVKTLDLAALHSLDPTVVAGSWRPTPENTEPAFRTTLDAPYSSYQSHLLLGIVHSWVKRDPQEAQSLIDSLPESPERSNLQDNFRQALLRFRPEDALKLALAERGSQGAIKVNKAAHALTKANRTSAIAALAELTKNDAVARIQVVRSITKHWATTDPLAAGEWSEKTLATDHEKETAFEEVFYTWSESNPDAASTWALALDPGKPRDSALRTFIFRTAHKEPAKAFQVGLAMADPHSQETALLTVITEWAGQDKPAAAAAIEAATSLPQELRTRLKTDLDGQTP